VTPTSSDTVDAVVVGGGPNGLAAAIALAREGRSVRLVEAASTVGGGVRSAELTLPGFIHDVCSAIHPFGRTSPFFASLDLRESVRWIEPPYSIGHPLDDGSAVLVERDVDATASRLGSDADAYRRLFGWLVRDWDSLMPDLLAPFHVPLRPLRALRLARFGLLAIQSATSIARRFRGEPARALLAGAAAHSIIRLSEPLSSAAGLVMLASAHADGWPFPEGGAGRIPDALAAELKRLGGSIETGTPISRLDELPPHRVALFDVAPRQLLGIAGPRLSGGYRRALERFRYGPGVFKLDVALDAPIPWRAGELSRAGTVHVGGSLDEIARSEAAVAAGRTPASPFILLAQQTLFDPTRAPDGRHTAWAYCHVPNGSTADMTEPILSQIERFAPGFGTRILKTTATGPAQLERYNPNNVGGDIAGGRNDLGQLFTRPSWRVLDPYSTPDPGIFLCSASTPPGGGVHGMCGLHAARSADRRLGS
jgi:phytoene dehydrogenase-like protein